MQTCPEFQSAIAIPPQELASLVNHCFTGYAVPIHLDYPSLLGMMRADTVDLAASTIILSSGRLAGVALVARCGWSSRLAAMAIAPDFRRQRLGSKLVAELLRQAHQRGDRKYVLETIEQNPLAVRLYQSAGFKTVRRLLSYRPTLVEGIRDAALEETDTTSVSVAVTIAAVENLPWQISPQTLTALAPPHQAFRLGPAAAIITDPSAPTITFRSLIVDRDARRKGWGTRLVRAIAAKFPEKHLRFSALVPDDVPPAFFQGLSFQPQLQMETAL